MKTKQTEMSHDASKLMDFLSDNGSNWAKDNWYHDTDFVFWDFQDQVIGLASVEEYVKHLLVTHKTIEAYIESVNIDDNGDDWRHFEERVYAVNDFCQSTTCYFHSEQDDAEIKDAVKSLRESEDLNISDEEIRGLLEFSHGHKEHKDIDVFI